MGKRLQTQRRGRGKGKIKVPSHKHKGSAQYPHQLTGKGIVEKILHDSGRSAPVAQIKTDDGRKETMIAPEGIQTGQTIYFEKHEELNIGDIIPLREIPEGAPIYNIELSPGDGGKIARSAGNYATIIFRGKDESLVRLPSGKIKAINANCKATIGIVAGGGRHEKPFLKAGTKHIAARARGKLHPVVKGVAMNPVSHPHGGGGHQHVGKGGTVKKGAPPGKKVGSIGAKRTGGKK